MLGCQTWKNDRKHGKMNDREGDEPHVGECHAHVIMDGMNYKAAVALHKNGVCQEAVRTHLEAYQKQGSHL